MIDAKLEFLKNQAGEDEGLGHAGIEIFRDSPFESCSREAGQNTLDAADKLPVKMVFRRLNVNSNDIPGIEKLRETIDICLAAACKKGTEKEKKFFENAAKVVSKKEIPVLEVADYNTTGLQGPPNESGSKFHSLVKSTGKSNKSTETSGGSFGIGKNAAFAVSDLRTVFYSTIYETDKGLMSAVQGKVQLVSHKDAEGIERTSKGYWGRAENFSAIECPDSVPDWLRREQKGTSIFSIGFTDAKNWSPQMWLPIVSNFFVAIDRGGIIVEVVDGEEKFVLDAAKLEDIIPRQTPRNENDMDASSNSIDFDVDELVETMKLSGFSQSYGYTEKLDLARSFHTCRNSETAIEKEFPIDGFGSFSIRILVQEGMPKRVAIIRNGMLIAKSLEHFGDKLQRFAGARDFAMVVEPADKEASKSLKSLENPQHNAFSAERIDDPVRRDEIKNAMKKLIVEIRTLIKENAEITGGDAVKLDELGEFFADSGTDDSRIPSNEEDPETVSFTPVKRAKPKPRNPVAPHIEGEEGGAGNNEGDGGAGTDGRGNDAGAGSGGAGTKGRQTVVGLNSIRNVEKAPNVRKVFLTPDTTGQIELTFFATGVFDSSELGVTSASGAGGCSAVNGHVVMDAAENGRIEIEITFEESYSGPIEIYAVRRVVQ